MPNLTIVQTEEEAAELEADRARALAATGKIPSKSDMARLLMKAGRVAQNAPAAVGATSEAVTSTEDTGR